MSAEKPASSAETAGQTGWRAKLSNPTVLAVGLYTLVAMAAAVAAYFAIFTTFAPYDDEGTSLVRLLAFLEGDPLYRDIWSAYGPFYFEVFGAIFTVFGLHVDTDTSRIVVIVLWIVTSFIFGIASQRLSGSLFLGVAAMIAAFGVLYVLAGEPMHPQGISILVAACFVALAVYGLRGKMLLVGAGCGALIAALTLSKINLGALGIAAVALAAVLTIEPLNRRKWVLWPVIAAFLIMPVYISVRDIGTDWVRELTLIEILTSLAVMIAAWPLRPRRGEDHSELMRWVGAAIAGFVATSVVVLVIIVLTGPSPADVYDGIIGQALGIRDVILTRLPFPTTTVDWSFAAVAAAALTVGLRRVGSDAARPSIWPGLLRVAAGLGIWYGATMAAPFNLSPSAENPDLIPMALAWVAVVPPAGSEGPPYMRFLRVLLPLFAVAQTMQVYPVAGSQMGIAAVTYIPVGAICLGDALTSLRAWSEDRGGLAPKRLGVVVLVLSLALVAQLGLHKIARPAAAHIQEYRNEPALPFDGARLLHMSQEEVDTYTGLVDLLHQYGCTDFIGYPNINSLYIWTGIEPPPPNAPGSWIEAVDSEKQQRTVDHLRASPRPCAIRSYARAEGWLQGDPAPDKPLVNYILDDFESVADVGDEFEFLLPAARAARVNG